MRRHPGEPLLEIRVHRDRQPLGAPQVAGDDFGARFVQQETGAVEQFHQPAGPREAALGKQHQASAAFQVFRNALDGVGRGVVDQKSAPIDAQLEFVKVERVHDQKFKVPRSKLKRNPRLNIPKPARTDIASI